MTALSNHRRKMHSHLRVVCRFDTCEETFANADLERAHFYMEHNALKCGVSGCAKADHAYSTWTKLKFHLITQHSSGEPTITCDSCDKTFYFVRTYTRHCKSAHQGKSFVCPHCPFRTSRSDNLQLHIDRRHSSPEQQLFTCDVQGCDMRTASKSLLARHVRQCHSDESSQENFQNKRIFEAQFATLLQSNGIEFVANRAFDEEQYGRFIVDFVLSSTTNAHCNFDCELDENQHRYRSSAQEVNRMLARKQVVQSGSDKPHVIMRINPHPYGFELDGMPCNIDSAQREAVLVRFLQTFVPSQQFTVVYFYFDSVSTPEGNVLPSVLDDPVYAVLSPHVQAVALHLSSVSVAASKAPALLSSSASSTEPLAGKKRVRDFATKDDVAAEPAPTRACHKYACRVDPDCGRIYQSTMARNTHERAAHAALMFHCQEAGCKSLYATAEELERHCDAKHGVRYACPFACGSTFGNYKAVASHLYKLQCSVDTSYAAMPEPERAPRARLFARTLTAVGGVTYQCPHDGRTFHTKGSLRRHLRDQCKHVGGRITYSCNADECQQSFRTEELLRTHVNRVHHGVERPKLTLCAENGCTFKTTSDSKMRQHRMLFHADF